MKRCLRTVATCGCVGLYASENAPVKKDDCFHVRESTVSILNDGPNVLPVNDSPKAPSARARSGPMNMADDVSGCVSSTGEVDADADADADTEVNMGASPSGCVNQGV